MSDELTKDILRPAVTIYDHIMLWCTLHRESGTTANMLVLVCCSVSPDGGIGSSALLGGVVKGAGTLFSSLKDASSKVMQSVAG